MCRLNGYWWLQIEKWRKEEGHQTGRSHLHQTQCHWLAQAVVFQWKDRSKISYRRERIESLKLPPTITKPAQLIKEARLIFHFLISLKYIYVYYLFVLCKLLYGWRWYIHLILLLISGLLKKLLLNLDWHQVHLFIYLSCDLIFIICH